MWRIRKAMTEDGLVLYKGTLLPPEEVTRHARNEFGKGEGIAPRAVIRRYAENYPIADATTPTSREFRALTGNGMWKHIRDG